MLPFGLVVVLLLTYASISDSLQPQSYVIYRDRLRIESALWKRNVPFKRISRVRTISKVERWLMFPASFTTASRDWLVVSTRLLALELPMAIVSVEAPDEFQQSLVEAIAAWRTRGGSASDGS